MKKIVIVILMEFGLAVFVSKSGAQVNLNAKALDCYNQVMTNSDIFKMNKLSKTDSEVQKLAISMCTYSDAVGAIGCYNQAMSQDKVFPNLVYMNMILFEQQVGQLCSNSHAQGKNSKTGDFDAIDCFKGVSADTDVLTALREYKEKSEFDLIVKSMCISSNAKGAIECYKEAKSKIKYPSENYQSASSIDMNILSNCKGSRKY